MSTFEQDVKTLTGQTPKAWIDRGIACAARSLLRSNEKKVISVSEKLGYANPSGFSRFFKRLHGAAPEAWRKSKKR